MQEPRQRTDGQRDAADDSGDGGGRLIDEEVDDQRGDECGENTDPNSGDVIDQMDDKLRCDAFHHTTPIPYGDLRSP